MKALFHDPKEGPNLIAKSEVAKLQGKNAPLGQSDAYL